MGFFSSKKRTTVEVEEKNLTLSKIVKFTYLQSLAIDGGLTSARDIAGETEAKQAEDIDAKEIKDSAAKFIDRYSEVIPVLFGAEYIPGLGTLHEGVFQSLFGKKTTVDVKVDYKETGWTLTKVWNQPQFDVIRYAIGIRDLNVAQFTYEETSEIISTPWKSPKEISKVVLNADQFIPGVFPPGNYIDYYIKPNTEDSDWIRINPLGFPSVFKEDGSIVPRIINFNVEQPISSRLEDSYITTERPVTEVVFRAVLKRPTDLEGTTASADGYSPILRSYRLLMTPRNGL